MIYFFCCFCPRGDGDIILSTSAFCGIVNQVVDLDQTCNWMHHVDRGKKALEFGDLDISVKVTWPLEYQILFKFHLHLSLEENLFFDIS